jgi:DNA-binding transcriptional LysR family regulator
MHASAGVYRWEFEKGRKSLSVAVNGPLIVDDLELAISATLDGVGLAYISEEHGAEHLATGALVKVLGDWCQPFLASFCTILVAGTNRPLWLR